MSRKFGSDTDERLAKLADDLISSRCFDIPTIIALLHERVNQERRLQLVMARLQVPPLAKTKFTATSRKDQS